MQNSENRVRIPVIICTSIGTVVAGAFVGCVTVRLGIRLVAIIQAKFVEIKEAEEKAKQAGKTKQAEEKAKQAEIECKIAEEKARQAEIESKIAEEQAALQKSE
jgi:hypothetical protein